MDICRMNRKQLQEYLESKPVDTISRRTLLRLICSFSYGNEFQTNLFGDIQDDKDWEIAIDIIDYYRNSTSAQIFEDGEDFYELATWCKQEAHIADSDCSF